MANEIQLHVNGKTWSTPVQVSQNSKLGDVYSSASPSVALQGNDIWMSYAHNNFNCCASCGGGTRC